MYGKSKLCTHQKWLEPAWLILLRLLTARCLLACSRLLMGKFNFAFYDSVRLPCMANPVWLILYSVYLLYLRVSPFPKDCVCYGTVWFDHAVCSLQAQLFHHSNHYMVTFCWLSDICICIWSFPITLKINLCDVWDKELATGWTW